MKIIHRQILPLSSCEIITLENGERLLAFSLELVKNLQNIELNSKTLELTPKSRQIIKILNQFGLDFDVNMRVGYYTISSPKIKQDRKKIAMYIQEEKDNYLTLAIHKEIMDNLKIDYKWIKEIQDIDDYKYNNGEEFDDYHKIIYESCSVYILNEHRESFREDLKSFIISHIGEENYNIHNQCQHEQKSILPNGSLEYYQKVDKLYKQYEQKIHIRSLSDDYRDKLWETIFDQELRLIQKLIKLGIDYDPFFQEQLKQERIVIFTEQKRFKGTVTVRLQSEQQVQYFLDDIFDNLEEFIANN